jgi:polyisoprenoid-binding protein YceI
MRVGLLIGTIMIAAAGTAAAQSPAPRMPLDSNVKLWLDGTSSVRGFTCSAKTVTANIVTDATDASAADPADLVSKASFVIPVAALDCGNGTMNGHMRKALKADQAPEISFVMTSYQVAGGVATINGTLNIAGKENPIQIPATIEPEANGVRVRALKLIDMTQWGVKPPQLMMGTMKVRPMVSINFDILVKR